MKSNSNQKSKLDLNKFSITKLDNSAKKMIFGGNILDGEISEGLGGGEGSSVCGTTG